jgi:hypothetical protein
MTPRISKRDFLATDVRNTTARSSYDSNNTQGESKVGGRSSYQNANSWKDTLTLRITRQSLQTCGASLIGFGSCSQVFASGTRSPDGPLKLEGFRVINCLFGELVRLRIALEHFELLLNRSRKTCRCIYEHVQRCAGQMTK